LNLKKRETGINRQNFEKFLVKDHNREFQSPSIQNSVNQQKDNRYKKLKRSNSVGSFGSFSSLTHLENKGKLKGNSIGTIQAPFTTLVETFEVNRE